MFIVIDGPFGVGKTTVARGLAAYRKSGVLLENFEENPFLQAFYKNPVENALETEFAFLLMHFHQLKNHLPNSLGSETVADFHLGKDLIYADLNLVGNVAKELFISLYGLCAQRISAPTLIVFLSATTDLLTHRIRKRSREFELEVDRAYCDRVNVAYEQFVASYSGRKLSVNMNECDFVKDTSLFARLSAQIDHELVKA